jgi:hypothetical protein
MIRTLRSMLREARQEIHYLNDKLTQFHGVGYEHVVDTLKRQISDLRERLGSKDKLPGEDVIDLEARIPRADVLMDEQVPGASAEEGIPFG